MSKETFSEFLEIVDFYIYCGEIRMLSQRPGKITELKGKFRLN
jgi:hypothetical protein